MSTSSTTTPAGATTTNTATSTSAATIVVPAYVYPDTNSTWSPLYEAFALRPDVSFIVIVNPDSGPGSTTTPDENYSSAIEQLNGYANVQTVGYVHTSYATRSIDDVLADVETYAGWSSASSSLAMHGIFFDEAPSEYDATLVQYMHTIDAYVKNSTGLQGAKTVIHNPGTICNSSYSGPNTDFSIIFENDYASWTGGLEADVAALPTDRNAYGIMMYSVPEWSSSTSSEVTSVVDTMSQYASYIFATSLTVDYYSSWASDWLDFVAQVPS
ncbi:Spherulation-specific family 4 [Xylariales sp. PMI_506]|nr:Spherulation-specific family 4 [Xylariales sp. PMI_506]